MRKFFIIVWLLAAVLGTRAATVLVSSFGDGTMSKANFDLAYVAASTGDKIQFDLNGSATWSTGASISKAITIDGNGTTLTVSAPIANGLFQIKSITSTNLLRITGFVFGGVNVSGGGHAITSALASNDVGLDNLRIDHNTFNFFGLALEIGGCTGVIDHNYFYNSLSAIETFAGTDTQATASWATLAAGTASAMFIEDNHFIANASFIGSVTQPQIDGYNGGKVVIRNNVFDSSAIPVAAQGSSWDTIGFHGSAAGGVALGYWQLGTGGRRAHAIHEIYSNTMTGYRIDFMTVSRGGSWLVYSNSLTSISNGTGNERNELREEECIDGASEGWQWDPVRTAWPAEDQAFNSFYWANTFDGIAQAAGNVEVFPDNSTNFIQLNRDYFLHAPAASGGSESFTGSNGASGSFPTDGGTHTDHLGVSHTYPTLGTMTFTGSGANAYFGYTPYIYPHPLTGASGVAASPARMSGGVRLSGGQKHL